MTSPPPREVWDYFVECYQRSVADLLDDPTPLAEAPADVARLQRVGGYLGLDFWAVAADAATPYELNRLREILEEFGQAVEVTS